MDAYDGLGEVPAHLTDVDFMQACAAALAPGGLLVANLFNGPQGSPERRVVEEFAMQMAQTVGPVCTFKVCVCVRERGLLITRDTDCSRVVAGVEELRDREC